MQPQLTPNWLACGFFFLIAMVQNGVICIPTQTPYTLRVCSGSGVKIFREDFDPGGAPLFSSIAQSVERMTVKGLPCSGFAGCAC